MLKRRTWVKSDYDPCKLKIIEYTWQANWETGPYE